MTTFISAPFGNYLKFKNAVSVTGTWTYKPRPGLFKQVVKTLRYREGIWEISLFFLFPYRSHLQNP